MGPSRQLLDRTQIEQLNEEDFVELNSILEDELSRRFSRHPGVFKLLQHRVSAAALNAKDFNELRTVFEDELVRRLSRKPEVLKSLQRKMTTAADARLKKKGRLKDR
jgi:hypothetical protein